MPPKCTLAGFCDWQETLTEVGIPEFRWCPPECADWQRVKELERRIDGKGKTA